jgi:hypothetical protein
LREALAIRHFSTDRFGAIGISGRSQTASVICVYSPDDDRFATPQEAALACWIGTPSADARVVEVRPLEDGVIVVIETDGWEGRHRSYAFCSPIEDGRWCWDWDMFESPTEAALSTWLGTSGSNPRITNVEVDDEFATVLIEDAGTNSPLNTDWNTCKKVDAGLWIEWGSTG